MFRFVVARGLFTDRVFASDESGDGYLLVRRDLTRVEDVARGTQNAHGVVVVTNPLAAAHIHALADSVRVIGRAGIGLDAIALDAARARGIAVLHLPNYATGEVADHAVMLILALTRRLLQADHIARTAWPQWSEIGSARALADLVVGVVGTGQIGRAVLERLGAFGSERIAYDPQNPPLPDDVEAIESLDELLSRSDVVSLHLPLSAATRDMIGRRELDLLRAGALLVNVSRGGLVDEDALADALERGQLGGAGLDVLAVEPPEPGARILRAPNTVLSPHFAWHSTASQQRMHDEILDGMVSYLRTGSASRARIAAEGGR